ncbi:MAG: putative lipid II flippase FtsW [Acidimicrobiia bacterium]
MTAVTPRIGTRFSVPRLGRQLAEKTRARTATTLPRPPAYVVVCATVTVLNVVGLVMILSASSVAALSNYGSSWYFFNRQLAWALVGAVAFIIAARVDYHAWRKLAPWLLGISVALLVAVLLPGIGIMVDGSRRWLGYGPMRMQPSELAKVALLVFGADLLTRRAEQLHANWRAWRPVLLVFGALSFLVILEPDLDSTIVFALIAGSLLLVAGARVKHLSVLGGSMVAVAAVLAVAAPYRRARVFAFLDPWSDTSNTGYQIAQSLIALGSGGVDGVGLGAGRAKWLFLPNAHTDFIFAIIGEELGLIGCLLVLGLFAGFGLVGYQVARSAPDRFGMLLAAGITTWVIGQAAINLGGVVGLLPVSGITLPFLSAGGSSLVFTMAAAGMLANVARQAAVPRQARTARASTPRPVSERPVGRRPDR